VSARNTHSVTNPSSRLKMLLVSAFFIHITSPC
jgi:hypothetical protein